MQDVRRKGARFGGILAALMAGTAVLSLAGPGAVRAQSAVSTVDVDIPAQPLADALVAFSRQTRIEFFISSDLAAGKRSGPVSGAMTPQTALQRMLAGTGMTYRFTNANTVTITNRLAQAFEGPDDGSVVLDTIDVTGTGGAGLRGSAWRQAPDEVYETAASVAHLGADTITSHGHNLNNAVRSVAGVYSWENVAQPGMAVNIRGLEGMGRVTSMIDGVRQNYRFTGHAPAGYTYVEPSLISGIDITKGAIATAGGAGTLAGAINYRTLTVDDVLHPDEKAGAQVTATFGGNAGDDMSVTNAGGVRFDLAGNPDGGSVFGAVNLTSAGSYEDGAGKRVGASWRDVKSGLLKVSLAPNEEHRLDLGGIYYTTDFSANFYDQTLTNKTLTAKYAYTPGSDLIDLRINGYFNETTSEWSGGTSTEHDGRVLTNKALGIDATNTSRWDFGDRSIRLDYGLEYYRDDFSGNTDTDANPDGVSGVGGGFVQATVSAGMFEVIPALRYDAYSLKSAGTTGNVPDNYWTVHDGQTGGTNATFTRPPASQWNDPGRYTITETPLDAPWRGDFDIDETRFKLSPKITAAVRPLDWLQLYGTYEHSFRPPSVNEMFFGGEHGAGVNASFLPNPNLKPEVARGWEIGANVLYNGLFAADDSLRVKAAYYSKDVDDFIIAKCVVNATMCWFDNAPGTSRLSGFEIDASYDVGWGFAGLSYSRNRSDLQFGDGIGGMGEPSRLPDDYTTLTAGVRLLERKLTLGARMNDVSKGTLIEGGGWETSAYRTYDLFMNWQPSDRLNLFANVTNLTNEQYVPAMSQDRGPGRRIFGGATVKFGDGPLFGHGGETLFGGMFGKPLDGAEDYDWSGVHVGLAGGYSWVDQATDVQLVPSLVSPDSGFGLSVRDMRGYAAEGYGGFDWQFSNGLVLGVGAGYGFGGDVRRRETLAWAGNLVNGRDTRRFVEIDTQLDWSATLRGRIGYAVGGYLPYVTGGKTWARYSHGFTFSDARGNAAPVNSIPPAVGAEGRRYSGWTMGVGLEKAITERLSVRTEYSFTDFGSATFDWKQQARPNGAYTRDAQYAIDLRKHDFKVGVSLRF